MNRESHSLKRARSAVVNGRASCDKDALRATAWRVASLRGAGRAYRDTVCGSVVIAASTALPEQDEDHTDRGSVNYVRRALDADTQATSLGDPPHLPEECILQLS